MNNSKEVNALIKGKKYKEALEFILSLGEDDSKDLSGFMLDDALYHYFKEPKGFCDKLEQEILKKYPSAFIKAVRTSQVFLEDERLSYLNPLNLEENIAVHLKIWRRLREEEHSLWSKISKFLGEMSELSIEEVLIETIFWLENERYKNNNNEHLTYLANTYNFFIKLYLHNTEKSVKDISKFGEVFIKSLEKKLKGEELNRVISNLLDSIRSWVIFDDNILQVYCFDLNIEPKEENGIIYFNEEPLHYYRRKLDGFRYDKNKIDYQKESKEIYGKLDLLLQDLFLKEELGEIFKPIVRFCFNKLLRYEIELDKYKDNSKNWFQVYNKLFASSIKENLPYLLLKEESYIQSCRKAYPYKEEDILPKSFKWFSYQVNKGKSFNRFNVDYDVWEKPFIKVGDFYFTPSLFFANNEWFYSASQLGIKYLNKNSNARKKTATQMENNLGELFKEKGYSVKVIEDKEANKIKGDVDIIVEDKDTTLFIQLKRTYFRVIPKDTYYETINSDRKASKQLNDATCFLKEKNDVFSLKNEPVKWIVSTSFEGINSIIDNCRKINYFDLLFVLRDEEKQSLKEIIDYLEKDRNILKSIAEGFPPMIELKHPHDYRMPIFADDKYDATFSSEYNDLYQEANCFYKKENVRKAIELFEQCLRKNSNDVDVYGSLGNCYAELKGLPNLKKYFEKALSIVPNEPYIKRNYALALIENGGYYKGIKMLFELRRDYFFVGDLLILPYASYSTYRSKLSKEENDELESIMKSL